MLVATGGVRATVTAAVPVSAPEVAVTVWGPPAVEPAVKSPELLMEPPPETDQAMDGWGESGCPYWSLTTAENDWVALVMTLAEAGETTTVVATGGGAVSVTVTLNPSVL